MSNSQPLVSLVLATFGRVDDVSRLIDSLIRQTDKRFELIVADQNRDDRVLPFVTRAAEAGLQVHHLRLEVPNLSAARNAGIAQARGMWAAFPDDDCWYDTQTVAHLLEGLTRQPAWSGCVMNWEEQSRHRASPPDGAPLDLAAWMDFKGGDASSITLVLRTSMLRDIGGFDEGMGVGQWFGAGEETDLVLRALQAGHTLGRLPQAVVHHRFHAASRPDVRRWRDALRRGRGTGALYVRHGMSLRVRLRGLLGPLWLSLQGRGGWPGLVLAIATVIGRVQGCAAASMERRA